MTDIDIQSPDAPSLSDLLDRVAEGEEIVLLRDGKRAARLTRESLDLAPQPQGARKLGQWKGQIWISDDFDDDLPEEIAAAFRGEKP